MLFVYAHPRLILLLKACLFGNIFSCTAGKQSTVSQRITMNRQVHSSLIIEIDEKRVERNLFSQYLPKKTPFRD